MARSCAKLRKQPGENFLTHGHFSHLSVWQPRLRHLTFETMFMTLSDAEARALLKLTEFSRQIDRVGSGADVDDPVNPLSLISRNAREQLRKLEHRIDESLRLLSGDDEETPGAHLRLDSRSPKDGVFLIPKLTQLLQGAVLGRHFDNPWSQECQQYDIENFHRCIIAAQEIRTGREAIELLRHSQRIEADLVLGQVANVGDASSQLVLRRWDPRVDPKFEVRAFVCGGRVTAITQYIETIVVPMLLQHSEQVKVHICEIVAEMQVHLEQLLPDDPLVGAPFYAADFVLIPDADESKGFVQALLIEINPPPPVAGTVLFDWHSDRDRAILTAHGNANADSPCLRLVQKQTPWDRVDFYAPAKRFVDGLRGRRRWSSCAWPLRCCRRQQRSHIE